jgi:hypothetical protein
VVEQISRTQHPPTTSSSSVAFAHSSCNINLNSSINKETPEVHHKALAKRLTSLIQSAEFQQAVVRIMYYEMARRYLLETFNGWAPLIFVHSDFKYNPRITKQRIDDLSSFEGTNIPVLSCANLEACSYLCTID